MTRSNFLVFLGGTFNSSWRKPLVYKIVCEYYDPTTVPNLDSSYIEKISFVKTECNLIIHIVTPQQKRMSDLVELTADCYKYGDKVNVCFLEFGGKFSSSQKAEIREITSILNNSEAKVLSSTTLDDIAGHINYIVKKHVKEL